MKRNWVFAWLLALCALAFGRTPQMTATRSFSVDTYEPEQEVTVTISLTDMDFVMQNGSLSEFLPPGWTFVKKTGFQTSQQATFLTDDGTNRTRVDFVFQDGWTRTTNEDEEDVWSYNCPKTFKYVVKAPKDAAGEVTWSGYFNVVTTQFSDGESYEAPGSLGDNIDVGGATALASATEPTYTVTFYGNGGLSGDKSEIAVADIPAGEYTLADAGVEFAWERHAFRGWGLAADATETVNAITVPDTQSVYALWEEETAPAYTVTFHGNGGLSGDKSEVEVADIPAGEYILADADVEFGWEGHVFQGWGLADDATVSVDAITVPDTLDVYAIWEEETPQTSVQVTYHSNHLYGKEYDFFELTASASGEAPFVLPQYAAPFADNAYFGYLNWAQPVAWNTAADGSGDTYHAGETLSLASVDLYIVWQYYPELEVFPLDVAGYGEVYSTMGDMAQFLMGADYLMLSTDGETAETTFKTSDAILASLNVGNWGNAASGEFKVGVRITNQASGEVSTVSATVASIEGAADPGGIYQTSQIATVSVEIGQLAAGSYAVDYVIDPENAVEELEKSNNEMSYYKGEGYALTITVTEETPQTSVQVTYHSNHLYGKEYDFFELTASASGEAPFVLPQYAAPFADNAYFGYLNWAQPVAWNTAADGSGDTYHAGETLSLASVDLYIVWQYYPELEVFPLDVAGYGEVYSTMGDMAQFLMGADYLMLSTDGETAETTFKTSDAILASLNVGNWGNAASGEFKVGVRITNQASGEVSTVSATVASIEGAADPGGIYQTSQIATVSVEIGQLAAGSYAVDYVIDPENAVEELEKSNNEMSYYKGEGYALTITVTEDEPISQPHGVNYCDNVTSYGYDEDVQNTRSLADQTEVLSFIDVFGRDIFSLKFTGWNTAPDGNGVGYLPGDAVTADLDLYAQYEREPQLWFWSLEGLFPTDEGYADSLLTVSVAADSTAMAEEIKAGQKVFANFNVVNYYDGDIAEAFTVGVLLYDADGELVKDATVDFADGMEGETLARKHGISLGRLAAGSYTLECATDVDNTVAEATEEDSYVMLGGTLYKKLTLQFTVLPADGYDEWPEDATLYTPQFGTNFREGAKVTFSWPAISSATSYQLVVTGYDGRVVFDQTVMETTCEVSSLAVGSYLWHVVANGTTSMDLQFTMVEDNDVPVVKGAAADGKAIVLDYDTDEAGYSEGRQRYQVLLYLLDAKKWVTIETTAVIKDGKARLETPVETAASYAYIRPLVAGEETTFIECYLE